MKRYICILLLAAATLAFTGCSRSIDIAKLTGSWSCTDPAMPITITITGDTFTQSSGDITGEPLKYEREPDGLTVKNTDGRELIRLIYNEEDKTASYTVKDPDGNDMTLTFTRSAE